MFSTVREIMITGLAVSKLMETRCAAIRETMIDDAVEFSKRIKLDERLSKPRDKFWEETDISDIRKKALDEAIKATAKITEELEHIREKIKEKSKESDSSGAGI